ncbi:hypothetical protein GCM10008959_31970 [Deinococcus seoulensis]|uniref:DUF2268 domain-containing protein n=1 Tax=Deinococcus seoulensis TaxID=1837379 RepID=A0ABQ2RX46_9DEIO|nr:DUF2268 domain-containing putative Zn-dependent protease [Deinococcus seoulensis]GGR67385.1 hypothetical protein GCM10008959_31970 [Deinococcus seoulensis]
MTLGARAYFTPALPNHSITGSAAQVMMAEIMIDHGHKHGFTQLQHSSIAEFLTDGHAIAQFAQAVMNKYGSNRDLNIVILPVIHDASMAEYDGVHATQREQWEEQFVTFEWSTTNLMRARATIAHEVAHHLRRPNDPANQTELKLTKYLLHEGIAECMVECEVGHAYVQFDKTTDPQVRAKISRLIEAEQRGTLTSTEESEREELLDTRDYYPAAYAVAKQSALSVQDLISMDLQKYAAIILEQLPHIP